MSTNLLIRNTQQIHFAIEYKAASKIKFHWFNKANSCWCKIWKLKLGPRKLKKATKLYFLIAVNELALWFANFRWLQYKITKNLKDIKYQFFTHRSKNNKILLQSWALRLGESYNWWSGTIFIFSFENGSITFKSPPPKC